VYVPLFSPVRERNILLKIKRRKAKWIGNVWRMNCLLKHVIEGKLEGRIEVMGSLEDDVSSYLMPQRKERVL
jgi:hypothetical protein